MKRSPEELHQYRENLEMLRSAFINLCSNYHVDFDEDRPHSSINRLVSQIEKFALDPKISKEALSLQAQGVRKAAGELADFGSIKGQPERITQFCRLDYMYEFADLLEQGKINDGK